MTHILQQETLFFGWLALLSRFVAGFGMSHVQNRRGVELWRLARHRFCKCKQQLRKTDSKRQSVTLCPGSGSFACCPPSLAPCCRTSSVGGGRSAVSRFLPEPLSPNPGRSAGPGFLARRMGSDRCVFAGCFVNLCLAVPYVCFFRPVFGSELAQTSTLGRPGSRMASKASSSQGGEELVGQALARSFWAQGLSELEAGRKQAW